jgi:hypothetical protein
MRYEEIIKPILERDERARNDDFYLYSEVLWELNPDALRLNVVTALRNHSDLNLPNYESVTRARRKVQAKHPELESERTRRRRLKEQEAYKEYAKIS